MSDLSKVPVTVITGFLGSGSPSSVGRICQAEKAEPTDLSQLESLRSGFRCLRGGQRIGTSVRRICRERLDVLVHIGT